MSTFNKPGPVAVRCAIAAVMGLLALGSDATLAADKAHDSISITTSGSELSDEAKSSTGSAQIGDEKPGAAPKAPARSLFRCWQEGRLIFEGRGYTALPPSQVAAELKSAESGSGRVQVLDMYQGICVLELPK
ncbi:MAG: hypothetical protein JO133_15750 [Burkholderiaceae bacterium]|nr:hypothetical protein [Burkholderiaceae bacterium]